MQRPLRVFANRKSIVGMVHLLPLPGSPAFAGSMQTVLDRARADAEALQCGGVDGIIVENYGDIPFYPERVPAVTVSALTSAVLAVRGVTDLPVGVNVLRNDAESALSIAACTGAAFIRVNVHTGALLTDQGWLQGRAFETLRRRRELAAAVAIFADVMVKHATPPPGLTLEDAARDTYERGAADTLIVSGASTGAPTDPRDAERVRSVLPEAPLWVGSGVTAHSAADLLDVADGIIVGSAFEEHGRAGNPVLVQEVERLVGAVRSRHP